jgi:hypothetical protein
VRDPKVRLRGLSEIGPMLSAVAEHTFKISAQTCEGGFVWASAAVFAPHALDRPRDLLHTRTSLARCAAPTKMVLATVRNMTVPPLYGFAIRLQKNCCSSAERHLSGE